MKILWSDIVAMVITAVEAAFEWQAILWEEYDVLVTFMLVFVGAVFFRLIVARMFGGGDSLGIGSDIVKNR